MTTDVIKPGDPRWQNPALEPRADDPAWLKRLRERCKATSVSAVARELGYSQPRLSQVLRGEDRYLRGIEARFAKLDKRDCPYLGMPIGYQECVDYASNEPRSFYSEAHMHWSKCFKCPLRPPEAPPVSSEAKR